MALAAKESKGLGALTCTGYLGDPFENRYLEGTASGLSMEDDRVFGGGEAARRTLALSGTRS